MTYLAGIHFSHAQSIEGLVTASTIATFVGIISTQRKWQAKANKEAGEISALPTSFWGRLVTPLHAIATVTVPVSYLTGVLSHGFRQPGWYTRTGLDKLVSVDTEAIGYARVVASLGLLGTLWWHEKILNVLGKQIHYIGPRERGQVVSTGNYAVIRHPIYWQAASHHGPRPTRYTLCRVLVLDAPRKFGGMHRCFWVQDERRGAADGRKQSYGLGLPRIQEESTL
ncbi:hypothetical protein D9757_010904 [Collybiopsis confluens]|uniref:Protein-S-isoprenylcysteine O-methyltransferase n=1 Tax=Collybiopsis confluens TaxID=2823264 RepID=A0A8H5LQB8_9AGAR|nr:hypothetical protein D9757_010904 [Collybiopsis confluens]